MKKIRRPPQEIRTEEQLSAQSFYVRACEYCILTRLAFKNSLIQTVGYVAHQSFEHLLKGGLAEHGYTIDQVRALNHDLPNLLNAYAQVSKNKKIEQFSDSVKAFEDKYILRYPGSIKGSLSLTAAIRKPEKIRVSVSIGGKTIPSISYNLEEFDELFSALATIINKDQIGFLINISIREDIYGWENYHKLEDTAV
jgi:HEPN domain-containing protein